MQNQLVAQASTDLAVASGQPNKLLLERSTALALLDRSEPDQDVRDALRDNERAAIRPYLGELAVDLRTAKDLGKEAVEWLMGQIGGFVKLTGGGWHPDQRQEFIEQAAAELAVYPAKLADEAIAAARRKVHQPARFVSWCIEMIEPQAIELRRQHDRIAKLAGIAGV